MSPRFEMSPNFCQLLGHELHIMYCTCGTDGKPHFQYWDPFETLEFVGEEIQTSSSAIGRLVTVTIRTTPEKNSTFFTLVLPDVYLGESKASEINTFGVKTLHLFAVAGSSFGQIQISTVTELSGCGMFIECSPASSALEELLPTEAAIQSRGE